MYSHISIYSMLQINVENYLKNLCYKLVQNNFFYIFHDILIYSLRQIKIYLKLQCSNNLT